MNREVCSDVKRRPTAPTTATLIGVEVVGILFYYKSKVAGLMEEGRNVILVLSGIGTKVIYIQAVSVSIEASLEFPPMTYRRGAELFAHPIWMFGSHLLVVEIKSVLGHLDDLCSPENKYRLLRRMGPEKKVNKV